MHICMHVQVNLLPVICMMVFTHASMFECRLVNTIIFYRVIMLFIDLGIYIYIYIYVY